LCIAFAPGGRFIIAGFKDGSIQIFDTASGESVYNFSPDQLADAANNGNTNGAIYAIAVRPDGTGFVAGGADKTARFFRFLLAHTKGDAAPQGLQAQCTREMSLPSELLNVTYSFHKGGPSSNSSRSPLLVCMALLDHTVRILYDDTLRLCLTLYGHSLPVLCVDISSDNMLVATGSADKTLKLWGLDFGDCHRSLFGHSDTVTTVQFVRHTHYLFSGSKDGSIRYWDGDRFEQILYLPGHKGTIWSLGVGLEGAFVFSAGQDRSLRRWMRDTDDLCFVEEEKERALEGQVDQQALVVSSAANSGMVVVLENDISGAGNPAETSVAAAAATTSLVAVKGGDLLMQTLDYLEEEIPFTSLESLDASNPTLHTELVSAIQRPSTNPYLLGLSPVKYFQRCVSSQIPRSDLEAALLLLPMTYIVRFICWLEVLCDFGSASEIETATRCLVTLLLCHTRALTSQSTVLLPHLLRLRTLVTERMDSFKNMLGMNQAAFRFVQRQIETDEEDKQALQQAMYVDPMLSLSGKETKEQPKKKQRHA
jgi:U3 small nucleolar RNA-associated protein 12